MPRNARILVLKKNEWKIKSIKMQTKTQIKIHRTAINQAYQMLLCWDRNRHVMDVVNEYPGINVTELFIKLRIDQADVSKRLMDLKEHGLVVGVRNGKTIHYTITDKALKVARKIKRFINYGRRY